MAQWMQAEEAPGSAATMRRARPSSCHLKAKHRAATATQRLAATPSARRPAAQLLMQRRTPLFSVWIRGRRPPTRARSRYSYGTKAKGESTVWPPIRPNNTKICLPPQVVHIQGTGNRGALAVSDPTIVFAREFGSIVYDRSSDRHDTCERNVTHTIHFFRSKTKRKLGALLSVSNARRAPLSISSSPPSSCATIGLEQQGKGAGLEQHVGSLRLN